MTQEIIPQFFELDYLRQELKQLPHLHRLAFAAAMCERLLSNYNAFSNMENWGDRSILRAALDEVWEILQGKQKDTEKLARLREACDSNNVIPDDDFSGSYYGLEAQEAALAICELLDASLDPTPQQIVKIAKRVRDTIESFVVQRDESLKASLKLGPYADYSEKYLKAVASHPLAVREMAKQNQDLRKLREADRLSPELLEWLRTSSYNNGKSLIDLS